MAILKARVGSAWESELGVWRWTGSAWVQAHLYKPSTGSFLFGALKYWDGSSWVDVTA